MFFPAQFTADNINHEKIVAFDSIVDKYAQASRINGCFTTNDVNNMKKELAQALYLNQSDITFTGNMTPKYRTNQFNQAQMIHFKVTVPIKKLLAFEIYWGVSDNQNQANYVDDGAVPSELLPTS